MIEVMLSEGSAGSMKAAKGKKVKNKGNKPLGLQGTSDEVICLGFMMDVGDISEPVDSAYRKKLIYSMYSQEQWGRDEELDVELRRLGDVYVSELIRLKTFIRNGEQIRIWYSNAPYSKCGFYHLCSLLKNYLNTVSVVVLPPYVVRDNDIVLYKSWSEVAEEEFASFLKYEEILSIEEIRMYANKWRELALENAPLRAVVNGTVLSVQEDFYDFLIWNRLTDKPVKECRLIGNILGQAPVGIGDWWYAARIEHFIQQGKIKVVEDSENKYERRIGL